MFYVEDNGVAARREFSASLLSVASNILSDMPRNALVYGSIVRGKGWEVTTNCLMGPLIGDVHRIAEKDVVYPRIIVDDPVVRIVHRKLDELPIPLAQDLDKKYVFNYLAPELMDYIGSKVGIDFKRAFTESIRTLLKMKMQGATIFASGDNVPNYELQMLHHYYECMAKHIGIDIDEIEARVRKPRLSSLRRKV